MIPFQYRTFWRALTTRGPLEPRRLPAAGRRLGLLGLPLLELGNAGALALDAVLFPFEEVEVEAPVFVIGPPRSGTTFLHRLLALDAERFTTFRLWQIAAPALSVQIPLRRLAGADARLGAPLRRGVDRVQERLVGWADGMHRLRLDEPEEDEALLAHAFATELLAVPVPVPGAFREYRRFDDLPDERRRALMGFYRGCVQRHLLLEGRGRTFLSKNPSFCHKVGSVRETFPGARFVLLVRRPADALASLASLLDEMRAPLGLDAPEGRSADREEIVEYVAACYRDALAELDRLPPGQGAALRYEDLAADPRAAVEGVYRRLGLPLGEGYAAVLDREAARAAGYRSAHRYSLEELGLTHARIEAAAGPVYERFGYARRGAA